MEFPSLGKQCSQVDCQQLDFIPLRCECQKFYCKDHFLNHCLSGLCPASKQKNDCAQDSVFESVIYKCHSDDCKIASLVEMACLKCNHHFCVGHRFHKSCYDLNCDTPSSIERYKIEKEEDEKHEKIRQIIEAEVTEKLRKAEQSSKAKTALKIQLMKLKSKAIGEKSIPTTDRIYLAIKKPIDNNSKPLQSNPKDIQISTKFDDKAIPVFVSKNWTLGRCIDSISNLCSVKNENNISAAPKLRLFRDSDSMSICLNEMDQSIQNLLDKKIIIDGERLILEYISNDFISNPDKQSIQFLI